MPVPVVLAFLVAALVVPAPSESQSEISAATTIYLVRHAEKRSDQGDDPDLTPAGRARARDLSRILGNEPIDRIYASEFRRAQLTVLPLAVRLSLPIHTIEAADSEALLERLREEHRGETVVVCGHSDTIPELIAGLGVRSRVEIPEDRYGDLFVVRLAAGAATLERRSFGR